MGNIELHIKGKCQDCPCRELKFYEDTIDINCIEKIQFVRVGCENEDLCDKLEKYIIEKISVE